MLTSLCLLVPKDYWTYVVPALKVQSITAFCLQNSVLSIVDALVEYATQHVVSSLIHALNASRRFAEDASADQDVSTAFQEALLQDWGDGVDAVDEALENAARLSHLHGSAMFFFAQGACATQVTIRLLSNLYMQGSLTEVADTGEDWDRPSFAEPHLFSTMDEVVKKFCLSETRDGHLIDYNVWRNVSESGGKVALFCTSFAVVVVEILKVLTSLRQDQFQKHLSSIFPLVSRLIRAHSDEIRHGVQNVFVLQVAPIVGVEMKGE
jgi:hypothetical protein